MSQEPKFKVGDEVVFVGQTKNKNVKSAATPFDGVEKVQGVSILGTEFYPTSYDVEGCQLIYYEDEIELCSQYKNEVAASAEEPDMVNYPPHYTAGGIETIDVLRAKMSTDEFAGFLKGNIIKYLLRETHKFDSVEDLKKAAWYLNKLIKVREEQVDAMG